MKHFLLLKEAFYIIDDLIETYCSQSDEFKNLFISESLKLKKEVEEMNREDFENENKIASNNNKE